MEIEGTNLAASKPMGAMSKREKKSKEKKRKEKSAPVIEVSRSYLQALENMISEQKLRVLLYQQVISKASEELGVDILKKVGSHRSGP